MSEIQFIGIPRVVGKFVVKKGFTLDEEQIPIWWVTILSRQSGLVAQVSFGKDVPAADQYYNSLLEVLGD